MFPLIPELRSVLEAQRARVEAIQRRLGRVVPWGFCRDEGAPVGDFKRAWTTARRKAGVPGPIFHDFRRTSVRDPIRAGIPETVATNGACLPRRSRTAGTRFASGARSTYLLRSEAGQGGPHPAEPGRGRSAASEDDPVIQGALGLELAEEFVRVKRREWVRYHTVSRWEIDRSLTLFGGTWRTP